MRPQRHESLVAWQRADDLYIELHQVASKELPPSERFELASQMRRAAYSVPANIAEGFARRYRGDRLRFLNFAESSLSEARYCLHASCRLGYISKKRFEDLAAKVRLVGSPLTGLVRSIMSGDANDAAE